MKRVKLFDDYLSMNSQMLGLSKQEYTSRFLSEKFDGIGDLVKSLHFEMDPKTAEEKKIEVGYRQGEVTKRKQIEGGNYSLRRFRKEIGYWDGNKKDQDWAEDVFAGPEHYNTIKSTLGAGPHAKKVKKVKWNQRKYNKWISDLAYDNDGIGQDSSYGFEMAQNAKHEPGLIGWVLKQYRGEDPIQIIQWDIEAAMESVVTEARAYKLKASEFGGDTFSAAYNVKGEPTWRVHSTYAIDQVSGENNSDERDVVFFEAMPINDEIYIKIGGINNLKRTNGATVGNNFGTTIEEWKNNPMGIAKEASDFLTDATHLKWINKKAKSQGQKIKWALKDDYSSVIEDLVNKALGLKESVNEEKIKYDKGSTYQSSGHWTVVVDSNSSMCDIRVNSSAGWRLDPHDDREETWELLDNGRQRATLYFRRGSIDKFAEQMFDLNDRTTWGNKTKLTAKDYADIIRLWIDMKKANESVFNEKQKKYSDLWSPYQKADILAGDMFGEMGLFSLSDDQLDQIIDLKKADRLAKKQYGEFGFKTLAAKEMEELLDNNPKLLKESIIIEENTVTFTLDDGDLDDKFLGDKSLSRNLDYEQDGPDTYYVLPKRDFDRLEDWADSSGYNTAEVIYVIDEALVSEKFSFSKKEVEAAANLIASAISKTDKVKAEVHDLEYDKGRGAGFDISIDGEKYDGGSYVVKDNGDVVNAAIGNSHPNAVYNTIGNKDIADVFTNMKKYESVVNEDDRTPTMLLADEIEGAEFHHGFGDGTEVDARSTKKTWDDGVPVLKYIARAPKKSVKIPTGKFEVVIDNKYGWIYWQEKGVWYGMEKEDEYIPFEF